MFRVLGEFFLSQQLMDIHFCMLFLLLPAFKYGNEESRMPLL